jgi:hypothetical protein
MTLGTLRLAPLTSIEEKNRSKRRWQQIDWSIWLHRPMQGRMLKAECTCFTGILIWVAIGFGIYLGTREDKQTASEASVLSADPARVQSVMMTQALIWELEPVFGEG